MDEVSRRAVEVLAEALASGAGGCTGGCSNRPCEVDNRDAMLLVQTLSAAGLTITSLTPEQATALYYMNPGDEAYSDGQAELRRLSKADRGSSG